MFVITSADVLKKLSALKASKPAGPGGLHYKCLLELKESLCEPLTCIFIHHLSQWRYQPSGERLMYHLSLKEGDKKQPDNYRRVSLTCEVCKIMELRVRD